MSKLRFSKFLAASMLLATILMPGNVSAAGTSSLSLIGSSALVGDTAQLGVYVNGTDLTTVTVKLSYDATKLSCTNASFVNGSVFPMAISSVCGGGTATVTRSISGGAAAVNGSNYVVGINFTTLAAGSADVVTAAGSQVPKNGADDWNGVTSGVAINATQRAAAAPAAPAPTAPRTAAPSAPVVTATPAPAETKVESATTTVKTFTATVIVIDSRGNVVPGATVTFNGKTATTDKNGKASFIGVTAGSYLVKATSGSLTASTNVTVNAKNKTTQNFMVTLPKAKSNRFGFLLGAGITGTIIGGGLVYMNRKRAVKVVEEVKKVAKKTPKVSTRLANASK